MRERKSGKVSGTPVTRAIRKGRLMAPARQRRRRLKARRMGAICIRPSGRLSR
jgi:hypothetical protein